MSVVDNLTGLFPPIVASGAVIKITDAALGQKRRQSPKRRKASKKNSPW